MKRVAKIIIGRYITFLPLIIFMATYKYSSSWETAFTVGGVAAGLYLLFVFCKHIKHDLLITGVNCFLIGGAAMAVFNIGWLDKIYSYFGFSTVLVWMFIVGLIATIFSPEGFVGVKSDNKRLVMMTSISLLAGVLLAIVYSMYFINIIYGPNIVKTVPQLQALSFVGVFLLRWVLASSIFKLLPNIKRINLDVVCTNEKAIGVYESFGFTRYKRKFNILVPTLSWYVFDYEYLTDKNSKLQEVAHTFEELQVA